MEIKFDTLIPGKIRIEFVPEQNIANGLVMLLDEVIPDAQRFMGKQPAMEHDLYEGISIYDLPPDFDTSRIKAVELRLPTVRVR